MSGVRLRSIIETDKDNHLFAVLSKIAKAKVVRMGNNIFFLKTELKQGYERYTLLFYFECRCD